MTHRKTTACAMPDYTVGDEVLFKYEGLLLGTVESVSFEGCKVRYEVTLNLVCDVPESDILCGGVQSICGGVQHSDREQQTNGGAADI